MKTPPIGIKPRHYVDAERIADIIGAIIRCIEERCVIQVEWVKEYNELTKRLRDENRI